jgi:hypothetical protein
MLLVYCTENYFSWVMTVGQLTNVLFKFCPGIPITEYENKISVYSSFMNYNYINAHNTNTFSLEPDTEPTSF